MAEVRRLQVSRQARKYRCAKCKHTAPVTVPLFFKIKTITCKKCGGKEKVEIQFLPLFLDVSAPDRSSWNWAG